MSWYRVGTVTIVNGGNIVVGAGTFWAANVQPGDMIFGPDQKLYEVDLVISDTQIALVSNYLGASVSGALYAIVPTQGRVKTLADLVRNLVDNYGASMAYSATSLKAELASGLTGTAGAGLVTYNPAVSYDASSVGGKLAAVQAAISAIASSGGGGGGGGAGGADVIGTAAAFPGLDPTGVADCTSALQAFFDACKGKFGYLPAGVYKISAAITLDPSYSYRIEGAGWSINRPTIGTVIKSAANVDGLFIDYIPSHVSGGPPNYTPPSPSSDERIRIAHLALRGPGGATPATATQTVNLEGVSTVVPRGNGIFLNWVNQLDLEDVDISDYQSAGIFGFRCYSSQFNRLFVHQNGTHGIHLQRTANAVHISKCAVMGNGMRPAQYEVFNILIDGLESLGPVIDGPSDVSYGGNSSQTRYTKAAGTLASITVSGGVATINAPGHGFSIGDKVSIKGATVAPALNTRFAATVSGLIGTNFFSVSTSAPAGTYTESTLAVAPFVGGVAFGTVAGGQIEAYSEECTGPGIYIAGDCRGVKVRGGYWQNDLIVVDVGASSVSISETHSVGINGGIWVGSELSAVLHSNSLAEGATLYVGGLPVLADGITVLGQHVGRGKGNAITNTAFGVGALGNADQSGGTTGYQSTAIGYYALNSMTTGYNNTALGRNALKSITTGFQNFAMGNRAGESRTTAQSCVDIGHAAGTNIDVGDNEINIGGAAGARATLGTGRGFNVHVGNAAGRTSGIQSNYQCTIVGEQITAMFGVDNFTGIGYGTQAFGASNTVVLGNASVTTLRCNTATISSLSDERDKTDITDLPLGLDFIQSVRPVRFTWRQRDGGRVGLPDIGVIAQQLRDVQAAAGADYAGLVDESDPDRILATPGKLLFVLIKAVQELSDKVKLLEAGA